MRILKNQIALSFIILFIFTTTAISQFGDSNYDIRKSVVKIISTEQGYNYRQPWQKLAISSGSGSGFILEGNVIMTNAHVVEDSKYLQVQKFGDPELYTAEVKIIGHDCDLALITVKSQEFFADTKPLEIGKLPHIMDQVVVLGYPIGGEELNITQGIVSRVEHITYTHSYYSFLGCQIDANINPGNSGGPVFNNSGEVVGVAFEGNSERNLSYMIPPPIIHHFLKDVEDGKYEGFPDLLLAYESMINEDARAFYKMPEDVSGVLVYDILPESPVLKSIKQGDVITEIDDVKIANDGTVEFRSGERTTWGYLTDSKYVGEQIKIKIYRNGKPKTITTTMTKISDANLVPYNKMDREPKYYVTGGFVFQPLTINYLLLYNSPPTKFIYEARYGKIKKDRKEVIVISDILPDDLNKGYDDVISDFIVSKVNGKKIVKLKDVIDIIENTKDKFIVIEEKNGEKIIFNTKKLREKNKDILQKYNVVKDRSDCYIVK
jgi:S1-C subfamily serine protease